jgi:peptidoglycan-associated lipoprotein
MKILNLNVMYSAIILALVVFLTSCGSGRSVKAIKSYDIGEYHRAEALLKSAAKNEKNRYRKAEYSFYLAESYRKLNMPKKAASEYNKSIKGKYGNNDALLYLAESLRKTGDYEKAREAYLLYNETKSFSHLGANGIKSCDMATNSPIVRPWIVEKVKPLASKYSDYSPAYGGSSYDQIYFTSMRSDKKKRKMNRITGQGNSSLYMSKIDGKGMWEKPERLEEPITSTFDDGTPNMSFDGKTLYYTRCPYDNTQPNTAQVFQVQRSGGKWGEPERIFPGGDSLMMAHPAISPDGKTLFFVSERPGGQGGKDIYKTMKTTEGWTSPQNLGSAINTPGDEMFPYVSADGTLYFSSNGHVGFGGLDIFMVVTREDGREEVVNLGKPINSESDDFGIVFQGKRQAGLFSSTRGSAKGVDNIYSFEMPEVTFSLSGKVILPSKKKDAAAVVRLVGTDGTNIVLPLLPDGSFGARLEKNTDYVLMASGQGLYNAKENFSTSSLSETNTIEVNIRMHSSDELMTFDPVYFGKGSTSPSSEVKNLVSRIALYLKNNDAYRIDVRGHASYSGKEENDIQLSDKRAAVVEQLLVEAGVDSKRILVDAIGSGEPAVVDEKTASKFPILRVGDQITSILLRRLRVNERKDVELLNERVELVLIVK